MAVIEKKLVIPHLQTNFQASNHDERFPPHVGIANQEEIVPTMNSHMIAYQ